MNPRRFRLDRHAIFHVQQGRKLVGGHFRLVLVGHEGLCLNEQGQEKTQPEKARFRDKKSESLLHVSIFLYRKPYWQVQTWSHFKRETSSSEERSPS